MASLTRLQEPGTADYADCPAPKYRAAEGLLLLEWREGESNPLPSPSLMAHAHVCVIAEGRGVPQLGAGIRARDGLPRIEILQQDEDDDADPRGQALHLPALQGARVHPFSGHLPP